MLLKKMKYAAIVSLIISFIFLNSCQQNSELSVFITEEQQRTITQVNGFIVKLKQDIPIEAMKYTLEDYKIILNSSNSRIVRGDDFYNISLEDMSSIINSIEEEKEYPNFSKIKDEQELFSILKNDFPEITEDKIINSFDKIKEIYAQQERYDFFQKIKNFEAQSIIKGGDYPGGTYSDEFWLLFWNPWQIGPTEKAAKDAIKYTVEEYGENGWGNQSDAMRHSLWNVLIACYVGGSKSERINWAKKYTDAHETGALKWLQANNQTIHEWDNPMDYHNNAEGRNYFNVSAKEKQVWWWKEVTPPGVDSAKKAMRDKSRSALKFGQINQLSGLRGHLVYYR